MSPLKETSGVLPPLLGVVCAPARDGSDEKMDDDCEDDDRLL